MADRATVNPVTVARLQTWCENHRATAGRIFRADAAKTDQNEGSSLNFDYIFRKLFQLAQVF